MKGHNDWHLAVAAVRAFSARDDAEPVLFYKGEYAGVRTWTVALASS
ncbi:hypothetical protein [Arthrobacter methylotrophus]|uniref:Uncharacterized protein n=1 Tax=Arthrobacter methylotrophus TaxID=121291 RepID=A0ABV5UJI3_9MICC